LAENTLWIFFTDHRCFRIKKSECPFGHKQENDNAAAKESKVLKERYSDMCF
jgi:hypothetical protein